MDLLAVLKDVRVALLATGLAVYSVPSDTYSGSRIEIQPPKVTFDSAMSGSSELDMDLNIYATGSLESAWKLIYRLCSKNMPEATPVYDALISHIPTTYDQRRLLISTADQFRSIGNDTVSATINLKITTNP